MLSVIIIDDDNDDIMFLTEAIDASGINCRIYSYTDPVEALRVLKNSDPPDFIFLDINMPVMYGHECLKCLRADPRFQSVKIAMISTSIYGVTGHSLCYLGANFTLQKPTSFDRYKQMVREVLIGASSC